MLSKNPSTITPPVTQSVFLNNLILAWYCQGVMEIYLGLSQKVLNFAMQAFKQNYPIQNARKSLQYV